MADWRRDVLGDGFECLEFDLGEDDEGPLAATLVRALPDPLPLWDRLRARRRAFEGIDVLYVHGWSDYFFQRDLARFWTDRGARFAALDLRKYGRSLRPGQTHGYIEDLASYDAEIGLAVAELRRDRPDRPEGRRRLILLGHSTGGLVLSLWADRHRGEADALVLNSPWLALQVSGGLAAALTRMVNLRARINPREVTLPRIDLGFYDHAQRLISTPEERALVNLEWRPGQSMPVRVGWLKAVIAGHARIAEGIEVGAPVCALLSARSRFGLSWSEEMMRADTVVEVEGVARAALRLGRSVTVERIDGALHDVFLSEPDARREAYARMEAWVRGWAARDGDRTG